MGFFDEPPAGPPPPAPDYRTPEWLAPPENVVPATVALDAVLVRRADLAVWVADALAFPTGLSFGLSVLRREAGDRMTPFFGPSGPGQLRFGLLLADGRKVVTQDLGGMKPFLSRPDRPLLRPRSGGGNGKVVSAQMWLWPLPPPGPLEFVCAWPDEGIEETRVRIDAGPVLAAAARAIELWPEDRPLPPTEDDVVI